MEQIDFVVTWVDGNDPEWFKEKLKYLEHAGQSGDTPNRFRDWCTFKYWFRGVEKFAPWVNRVYLVTCGHYPEWLNTAHPKLRLVKHTDYIPQECLPTFNSNTIEMFIHKIPDLNEHFVLFNDDIFLTAPTVPEDFFVNGVPCDEALMEALTDATPEDTFPHIVLNNAAVINKYFNKQAVLKKHFTKFFNPKYGVEGLVRNICLLPFRYFSSFKDLHVASSHTKSGFEKIWSVEPELLMKTGRSRFRSITDVNHWLVKCWRICNGEFVPRSAKLGKKFDLGVDPDAYKQLVSGKYKVVCLNDAQAEIDFDAEKEKLCAVFEKFLPEKSSYEI